MTEIVHVLPGSMKLFYDHLDFAPAVIDGQTIRCSGIV